MIRHELFSSRTAAHAFDILHVESEEINPFLEEPA
jgi:hypothetical protein